MLHEINSEESTVSLENVKSFGTEGRKRDAGKPAEEIAPSDQVYEYIVFRGSDVKDLRIEQAPVVKEQAPPAVPDDPAIVGVSGTYFPFSTHRLVRCLILAIMMKYSGCKNSLKCANITPC